VTYRVILAASARRSIEQTLTPTVAAAVIEFLRGDLASNPHRVGKPLRWDLTGSYSARRGEYRIIYQINDEEILVTVISVRHRRDAYRR
jgi:mRNA interferase RelE/StbE